ncbi:hypothetical protein P879_07138 [Paragonimus westermani]|uniref:ZZ-type domain-containing protein n=1 Tax=Paragonimus westermani TaxID=34504 RepID=A0A8T0D3M6_9TREM|nr:hypothetical protein P879_07138 [Paragonimus westermani]
MWLPLLHRVMLAEQVVHNVRCGVCQRQPLSGLRYRCLRCLNFDLCQQCFFSGRTARSHKLTHPMQEYCTNSTSGDSFRDFTRIVRNRFRSRERSQRPEQPAASGHGLQSTPGSTSLSRGRTRCCDTASFGEDKPRPAPVFGSDSTSMLPREVKTAEVTVCDSPDSSNAVHSQTQSPVITDTPISRPVSTQIFLSSPDHRLPPRAASDTRHTNTELNYGGRSNGRDVYYPDVSSTAARQPLVDEEHQLIAQYSRELRQQSEPQLNPLQQMVSSTHSSIVPPGMDRSTISDGFPVISTVGFNITDSVPPRTGYMSLDRRQVNRTSGYAACNGQPSSIGVHAPPIGFSSAYSSGRLDPQSIAYRTPVQPYPYPLTTSSPMNRFGPYDSYGPTNIQRSYSLRARSQPPPDLHMNALRPIPGGGGGVMDNSRSPWFTGTQPPQPPLPSFLSPADQTIRSLEEERKALQLEYERLRQRAHTPTYNNHVSAASRQIQAQQQNQQRMARMQLQQHQLVMLQQQQQQDAMRANVARGYAPRMSMQRPPSAGPPVPSGPPFSRLNSYSGSLGRATSASNGLSYPTDLYGSEPRVSAYPYGSDLGPEFSLNASAGTGELATEARLLREHRGRLEVRMQQLEDHNKQLEQKMQRLRQYLVSGGVSNTGTLPSTNKVAADLLLFDQVNAETKSSLRQRSASGGLGGQFNLSDGKSYTGSGSVGQLVGTGTSELKQSDTRTPMEPAYTPYSNARQVPSNTLAEYYQVPTDSYPATGSQLSQGSSIQPRSHQTAIR